MNNQSHQHGMIIPSERGRAPLSGTRFRGLRVSLQLVVNKVQVTCANSRLLIFSICNYIFNEQVLYANAPKHVVMNSVYLQERE